MHETVTICTGKIHRAIVTGADVDYVGSITVDALLLEAAGIFPYQLVHINNVRNGAHWETYAVPAEPGSGTVCLNGPPAHHFQPGDLVVVLALRSFPAVQLELYPPDPPKVVCVDDQNRIEEGRP